MPSNEQVQMLLERRKNLKRKQFIAKTEIDGDERTVTAVISTATVDREKEVLLPNGMDYEAYMRNPVVLWAHDYRNPPIARALWMKKGRKEIKAKILFAPRPEGHEGEWKPDSIYELFKGGFLNAFSIGFLPAEDGSHSPTTEELKKHPEWADVRRIYDKWELLEFSPVPVPANPEALAVAVKAKELNLSDELIEQLDVDDSVKVWADTATDVKPEGKEIDEQAVLRPYPNEHACRLKPPNYPKYRRVKCQQKHDGKCIDVIFGIKSPEKSEIQSLRFDKKIWDAGTARSVCSARGGTFEAAKIQVRARPKLQKHCIMRRGYDPNEIKAMAEAQVRGDVYFKK